MNYKKIIKDNYTFHIINTDRFKVIDFGMYFTSKFDKKDIPFYSMLHTNLTYTSKKYNTKNKIAIKSEELYGQSLSASYDTIGSLYSFSVGTSFLNPIYTEDKYFKDSIDFFFEVLLNPNVKNNAFDSKYFNIIKNDKISSIKSRKDNINSYAGRKFSEIMYKGTPLEYDLLPTLETIEEVNEKNLYDFYKKQFDGSKRIDVFLLGEIKDEYIDYIEKKLIGINGKNLDLDIYINKKYKDELITTTHTLHFNQSRLYLGYRVNGSTDYELLYVLRVFNTILGTMNNSILFSVVREENSLCYSIRSFHSRFQKTLVVSAGINRTNYDKAVNLIKECVELMSDKNKVSSMIGAAKKTINTFLNVYYDDASAQVRDKYLNEFDDNKDDIETMREIINNVTVDEIVELSKKIKLSVIYMLEGDN